MNAQPSANIGLVILAAGASTRMGQPKQLLSYRGKTLVRHAAETALSVQGAPVVIVLGAELEKIAPALTGLPVIIAENADWRDGMGGSVRTGLGALLAAHPETVAAIFLVCDQPFLSAKTLAVLIAKHRETNRAIVASAYGGALGVPALFHRSLFPELLALQREKGAKHIIQIHREEAVGVSFEDGAFDLDTPSDCGRLQFSASKPALPTP